MHKSLSASGKESRTKKIYESHIPKALYRKNVNEVDGKKKVQNNLLCDMAKIWSKITQKSFMKKWV